MTVNVTLFGDKVSADVIKRRLGETGQGLMTAVPTGRGAGTPGTTGRSHVAAAAPVLGENWRPRGGPASQEGCGTHHRQAAGQRPAWAAQQAAASGPHGSAHGTRRGPELQGPGSGQETATAGPAVTEALAAPPPQGSPGGVSSCRCGGFPRPCISARFWRRRAPTPATSDRGADAVTGRAPGQDQPGGGWSRGWEQVPCHRGPWSPLQLCWNPLTRM